jgi:hypothetical protein
MRAAAVVVLATCALAWAAGASADHLDPQNRFRSADQKRAASMLARKTDLGGGYVAERTSGLEPHLTCRALDESDLVLTGHAKSPYWSRDLQIVGSTAAIYRTRADARMSGELGTSRAGMNCLRDEFRKGFAQQGEAVRVTIERLSFPRFGDASFAHRLVLSGAAAGSPSVYIDIVVIRQGRGQVGLLFAGVLTPPKRTTEVSLARVVATRMAKAMRGA